MVRCHFDAQLEQLHTELIKMGALCEEAIRASVTAMEEFSPEAAEKAQEKDSVIDRKERDIEALCMRLLLQQQPVASDLRRISSALKMISDMERIGDQARDIAEIMKHVKQHDAEREKHIRQMAEAVVKMVTDSVDSFVKMDLELAQSVIRYDDVVDELFVTVRKEIIESISTDRASGELYVDLLMAAKYLERIGDHATNIAEWVEYAITGRHILAE